MSIFDVSADALLHCFAVDEQENGQAQHLFAPMEKYIILFNVISISNEAELQELRKGNYGQQRNNDGQK